MSSSSVATHPEAFVMLMGRIAAEGEAWQERSLCPQTDPDEFFPEKGASAQAAKAICASCEVRDECLEYALEHDERFGIWGGLTERQRRRLKQARKDGESR